MNWSRSLALGYAALMMQTGPSIAQLVAPPDPPSAAPSSPQPAQPQQLPWYAQLGLRVFQVEQVIPVIDRVVLVPDAATYLDELGKWSLQGRWPVLIEDEVYAAMFVRRFAPGQLIRRESVGPLTKDSAALRKQIEDTVVRAWSGDPATQSSQEAFAAKQFTPFGVVIASPADPAWTAAVALAAGRGQPIGWLEENFAEPGHVLSSQRADDLLARIAARVQATGYPAAGLGDAIETITVCRDMGGRISTPAGASGKGMILATTDAIGRGADAKRWAFGGWIFGDSTRSAYMAMCSLFLPRQNIELVHTYPVSFERGVYGPNGVTELLQGQGYRVNVRDGEAAAERPWMNMLPGGTTADVFAMNTKGNADFFDMFQGRCYPADVPILNTPVALHLVHSWSGWEPENPATLGGRWLQHGAYAYVGSVDEPGLQAFQPMRMLAERWISFTPFLVAARNWDAAPWKVNTIGDPLMICAPPENPKRQPRLTQPTDYGVDLGEHLKELLRTAKEDPSGAKYGEAMHILDMLGRDDIAVQVWGLALEANTATFAARPALGPLFRKKKPGEIVKAWMEMPTRDPIATDILWAAVAPKLGGMLDDDTLLLLSTNIRRPYSDVDAGRIASQVSSALGQAQARSMIQREIDAATGNQVRARLTDIMKKY